MKDYLHLDGRRLAYQLDGPDNRLPLVLLHGFCEDASVFDPLMPLLPRQRVLRVDLPGFGASDVPGRPGMAMYAEALRAVLDDLNIRRCVLVGHSMGGYTTLEFASRYPEYLAGYGLFHAHPFEDSPERIENRRRGIEMIRSGKKDLYVSQLFPALFTPAFAAAQPQVLHALIEQGRRQPDEGIVAALEGMIGRRNHLDTLQAANCPVLFVLGKEDQIVPYTEALDAASKTRVADIRLLPGVAHMGMYENPVQVASALNEFSAFVTASF